MLRKLRAKRRLSVYPFALSLFQFLAAVIFDWSRPAASFSLLQKGYS
jgi:hypothetical protein